MRFSIVFLNVFYMLFIFFTFTAKQYPFRLTLCMNVCSEETTRNECVSFYHCFSQRSKQKRCVCVCVCTIKIIIIKTNKWEIILCFVGFVHAIVLLILFFTIFCTYFVSLWFSLSKKQTNARNCSRKIFIQLDEI